MSARGLLLAALVALGTGASAQTGPAESARAALSALEDASLALEQADSARDRVAALTQTVQAYEAGLAALRESLRRVTIREAAIRATFEAESERLSQLLGVLQAMQATPAPAQMLHPQGALGTARSGMMLSDVAPGLQKEAAELGERLRELADLRLLQEAAVDTLQGGLENVQAARTELSLAISNRTDLPKSFTADAEAMRNLLDSTETLESFARGLLDIEPASGETVGDADFQAARGTLSPPVQGRLLRRFDEPDAAGISRPGLILAARPLSLVTTPWAATIRYLGPLLDYGNVVILEPAEGYLIVLAGLGQVYGAAGEVLPQGAAVGLMGGAASDSQAFLISSGEGGGTDRSETLYIEIRENGTPVNPEKWFAGNKD